MTLEANSSYSQYLNDDDEFLEALRSAVLPGDVETQSTPVKKRKRDSESPAESSNQILRPRVISVEAQDDTYGSLKFGDFGEYMRRKRAKLQIQDANLRDNKDDGQKIFKGLAIYINGWTEPSVQELRKLIVENGGTYHTVLDRKSLVTHIITCSLTPAKLRDWKNMKVVTPAWLVESARAGVLLSWHDYIFKPGNRIEAAQGQKAPQKTLLETITVSPKAGSSANAHTVDKGLSAFSLPHSSKSKPDHQTPVKPGSKQSSLSPGLINGAASPPPRAPIYTSDPITHSMAARVPGYSADTSNISAAKAMRSEDWRVANTSAAGADFIDGYYKNSRLHHLSMWKAELKELVKEAQERAEVAFNENKFMDRKSESNADASRFSSGPSVSMRGATLTIKSPDKGKGKARADDSIDNRVIMHCDFDCFFASVGILERPHLRGKPVVVCHSQGNQGGSSSTSEIASSSYEARKFGIKNGMSLQQARKLCPEVVTVPYEFEKYKQISLQFYTILMGYADDLQAVSVDEALIEVTSNVAQLQSTLESQDAAKDLAEIIRADVLKKTGCQVSIGVANNIMMARLSTRRAKPAGSYHLRPSEISSIMAELNIDDLHGFGYAARDKAQEKFGTSNLGELSKKSRATLCDVLGTASGEKLYDAIRGIDRRKLESDKPRKSVSAEINYGIRFKDHDEAKAFIYELASEISKRLQAIRTRGRSLTLKVMKRSANAPIEPPKFMGHGICDVFNKQVELFGPNRRATNDAGSIGDCAWGLLRSFAFDPTELRGLGIQIQRLESEDSAVLKGEGQAKLVFKSVENKAPNSHEKSSNKDSKTISELSAIPQINVQVPSQEDMVLITDIEPLVKSEIPVVELPSFSQVDNTVLESLPDDIRRELQQEYERIARSKSPKSPDARDQVTLAQAVNLKGRFKPPSNVQALGRITRQLAPRSRPHLSPSKRTSSDKFISEVTDAELERFGIDPTVFRVLPPELQREQLAGARFAETFGNEELLGPPKVLKRHKVPTVNHYKPPKVIMPKFVDPPRLRQRSESGEKLYLTETDDIQSAVEAWIERNHHRAPNQRDIEYFGKFLLQCADRTKSTDTGLEKAVAIMKWWLVILRRRWRDWEADRANLDSSNIGSGDQALVAEESVETSESAMVAKAWWKAFRDVKQSLDEVVRKRFGGNLSIK